MGALSKLGKKALKAAAGKTAKAINNAAKEMSNAMDKDAESGHSVTYYVVVFVVAIIVWFIYFFSIIFNKLNSSGVSEYTNVQMQSKRIEIIETEEILVASNDANIPAISIRLDGSTVVENIVETIFRGFWNFLQQLDPGEEITAYNINAPFDEILNKLITIIQNSYSRRITEINAAINYMICGEVPDSYINEYGYAVSLNGIEVVNGCQLAEEHHAGASIASFNYAITQSRCLNYAAIISILNMDSRFDIETVSYMEWKDFFRSDEVRYRLCQAVLNDAYCFLDDETGEPLCNSDGSIIPADAEDENAVLYYEVTVENISLLDLFELIGVEPHEPSEISPSFSNYELAMEREMFIRSQAPNVNFGDTDIDYTIMSNYTSAYIQDLHIPTTGMSVPIYYQQNYGNAMYGPMTIADAGCCPTSLAMVITYYTGETITPVTICSNPRYAAACVAGKGTDSSVLFPRVCEDYGLFYTKIANPTVTHITNALQEGKLVIISVKAGKFTRSGHFILIRGCTDDGYFFMNDPNIYNYNKYQTDKFTINDVMTDIVNAYIVWQ